MLNNKRLMFMTLTFLLVASIVAYAATPVNQVSALSGKVSAANMVSKGQSVKEGQVLVMIESITGTTPAARANTDGTVTAVMVKPGDMIKPGQVVAQITPAR